MSQENQMDEIKDHLQHISTELNKLRLSVQQVSEQIEALLPSGKDNPNGSVKRE
jgi:hypothetical protein